MQKIILYLQCDELTTASWTVLSQTSTSQKTILHGSLEQLKADAADKTVYVIAPAADVLQTEAKLPKLNRQRLIKALPFALEEQLLSDVNDLHFAPGNYAEDGSVPVAIVHQQKMQTWLGNLHAHGIYPAEVIPAVMAVPYLENCWNIYVFDHAAIIRTGLQTGLSCDKDNLAHLLELTAEEKTQKPQAVYLENYTDKKLDLPETSLNIIEKKYAPEKFLEEIAASWNTTPLNLAQGVFAPKRTASQYKKVWQLAGYLFAAWIALVLVGNLVSLGILRHENSYLSTQINTIYKRNFPNAKSMVAPKERMTEKLNGQLQGSKNHLLLWIAYLGQSLQQHRNVHIARMEYRDNQLIIDVKTLHFDDIDKLVKSLVQQGLTVKQQNVATADNEVRGTLLITENSA